MGTFFVPCLFFAETAYLDAEIPLDTLYLGWHSITHEIALHIRRYLMDIQLKRGLLDICVLSAIKFEDSYGYKIIKDVSPHIKISESTLYPILKRLEENEFITVRSEEFNGRLRKYYHITSAGLKRIDEFSEDWKEVMDVYDFVTRKE